MIQFRCYLINVGRNFRLLKMELDLLSLDLAVVFAVFKHFFKFKIGFGRSTKH